ncbi:MAG: hypothetical protein M4579_001767 [Chaenotheca gracillima]|nr:MAG: hypothetical protein M4579_001767 [Chaenotheca gracillima]
MSDMDVDEEIAEEEDFVDAPEDVKAHEAHEARRAVGDTHRKAGSSSSSSSYRRDSSVKWGSKSITSNGPRRVKIEPALRDYSKTSESKRLSIGSAGRNGGSVSSHGSSNSNTPVASQVGESESTSDEVEKRRRDKQPHDQRLEEQEKIIRDQQARIDELQSALRQQREDKEYWSKKHEELHAEYMRTGKELRILKTEVMGIEKGCQREWDDKHEHLIREAEHFRDLYLTEQQVKQELKEQAYGQQQHISALKHDIATSTKMSGQITDDEFREKIQTLGHDVQNWIVNKFRKATIEPDREKLPDDVRTDIIAFAPSYKHIAPVNKIDTINAIVSGVLAYDVLKQYFFGMEDARIDAFMAIESYMKMILQPAELNRTRASWLAKIMESNPDFLTENKNKLAQNVEDRISNILAGITGAPNPTTSRDIKGRDKTLRSIIESAIHLSHLFRIQRAQFTIEIPSTDPALPAGFDPSIMEDIKAGDDAELRGRPIAGVTFPAFYKTGDENGDNLHLKNILAKSKVMCQPD